MSTQLETRTIAKTVLRILKKSGIQDSFILGFKSDFFQTRDPEPSFGFVRNGSKEDNPGTFSNKERSISQNSPKSQCAP
jgi:hypothetical protein